jgi:hypothetical protein
MMIASKEKKKKDSKPPVGEVKFFLRQGFRGVLWKLRVASVADFICRINYPILSGRGLLPCRSFSPTSRMSSMIR